MLSNPTNSLPPRSRAMMHRRQRSTPSAYDTVKMSASNLPQTPSTTQQRQQRRLVAHRRGLSLDTRRQHAQAQAQAQAQAFAMASPTSFGQEFNDTVSNTTNTGLPTTPQHVLQESQQQRIARPGPSQAINNATSMVANESFLISPQATPQSQRFNTETFEQIPRNPSQQEYLAAQLNSFYNTTGASTNRDQRSLGNMISPQDFELFSPESTMSTPTFSEFRHSPSGSLGWISEEETMSSSSSSSSRRRHSRRISNGIMDRVSKYETLGVDSLSRPHTPPNQNAHTYFPPTPMETPCERMSKHEPRPSRFSDDYDESMEATIKASPVKPSNSASMIFEEMRRQAETSGPQVQGADMVAMSSPTGFLDLSLVNGGLMNYGGAFEGLPVGAGNIDFSPTGSHHSTPMTPFLAFPGAPFDSRPNMQLSDCDARSVASGASIHSENSSRRGSPHRRTESIASMASAASAASIADINIEETKTDTGVTMDDIAIYIEGPDLGDGKWICKFVDCGKRFGRKENIKSHVQTHLNDRQYKCPHCKKCFVRQHDLKRHAKIHTGVKPYPCECGNSFARHDALTRHRQRGMCIGAFDGVVRKIVKRGRPRKNRPEMEERIDKSARTRSKNSSSPCYSGASPSATSHSGYSDFSSANSPSLSDFSSTGKLEEQAYNDLIDLDMVGIDSRSSSDSAATVLPSTVPVSSAPMPTMSTLSAAPIVGGIASPRRTASPRTSSPPAHVSPASLTYDDGINKQPQSSPATPVSHCSYHPATPPELSASSSPPASSARLFELEPIENEGLSAPLISSGGRAIDLGNISSVDLDDDLLKAFTNQDSLLSLDGSGLGMLNSKFDEEYGMFSSEDDDLFFGTT